MSQRPVYEDLQSPSYERLFVPIDCFGDKISGILLYRKTDSDTWGVNYNVTYDSADLEAAAKNTSDWFKYLGTLDFDSLLAPYISKELIKLKSDSQGGAECNTEQA